MMGMAAAVLLSSCVKDTLYDTPHPDKGAVTVSLTGVSADEDFAVDIDGKVADITGSPFTYPDLLAPGTYRMVVYNRVEGFTFDGRTARVNTHTDGTSVIPLPGYLKTVSQEITVTADDTLRVNAVPVQRVRDLQLELEVTQGRPELIQSVTATLSGIAGIFDMEKGQTIGEPASTVFSFTRDGSKLTADARLLGTMGAVQTLVLDIVFTDGGRTQRTEVDLTEALADFNSDMITAYRVTGTLETPVGMEECNAEITDWEEVEGGNASATL
ncbi:FimB/Mfa2 family fimbrial subunit [Barnesiella viscericola]|uniref:FimB/Mfa2 family fimbrial subunit n=1 Tax=Barnesiella viscericola TaxID=397865 RepID=UPI002355EAD2|nr:FimB/Mfa2 family fimbrial subunit [Barnesiella viscericola]